MPLTGKLAIGVQSFVGILCLVLIINKPAEGRVCFDVQVRNTIHDLEIKLRNCTVVIGSLTIALIEKVPNKSAWEKVKFPELR